MADLTGEIKNEILLADEPSDQVFIAHVASINLQAVGVLGNVKPVPTEMRQQ